MISLLRLWNRSIWFPGPLSESIASKSARAFSGSPVLRKRSPRVNRAGAFDRSRVIARSRSDNARSRSLFRKYALPRCPNARLSVGSLIIAVSKSAVARCRRPSSINAMPRRSYTSVYDIRLLMLIASPNSSTAESRSFRLRPHRLSE
jgi:hypothetical protein